MQQECAKQYASYVQITTKSEINQIQQVGGEMGKAERTGGEERDLGWKFRCVVFKGSSALSILYYHLTNSPLSRREYRYLFWGVLQSFFS